MDPDRIEIRYSRAASAIGLLCFVAGLAFWVDWGFVHSIPFTVPVEQRGGPGYWLMLPAILLCIMMTGKTVIDPSLIFAADRKGVELGRGVFISKVQRIEWSKVTHIGIDLFGIRAGGNQDQGLHLTFEPDVALSRVGYPTSRRDSEHVWEIRNSVFTEPLEEVVARLEKLRSGAGATAGGSRRR